ncbi:hypothetical protein [Gemmatimonas sp.]|uniref:hypothetical protein n=1 Tax=Gemmatimonas sp. TaxID=1962908 RepID=UPI00286CA379|nr:hypothetical protein [Gemmatimonas sp.]
MTRTMFRQALRTTMLLGMLLMSAPVVNAQVDPRGAMRTIAMPHFRVHFRPDQEAMARRVAFLAESAYAQLSRELAPPSGPVDLLIADNVDASNGYAQVFPTNRVVIYAVPPIALRELRFHDEWLRMVITHEMAHIFHIDRARGAWAVGRAVFGRNPLFFPNAFTPSWVKEGLAVHYESKLTGTGRAVSTDFPMIARVAVRDAFVPGPQRWSLSTSQFPGGQTAYAWGSLLMHRAAAQRDGSLRRYVDITAANVVPFLLSRNSRAAFGVTFDSLFARMNDSLRRVTSMSPGDSVWHTVSANGWYAAAPRWIGNDTLAWSSSNGRDVSGLYVASIGVNSGAQPLRLAWRNTLDVNAPIPGDDNGAMVFAQSERMDPYVVRSDLYRSRGADRGGETRLTKGARLAQPDVRADGSIVAVQLGADRTRLVRVSATGESIVPITPDVASERWAEPRWSPDGQRIVAAQLLPTGEQRIVVMDVTGDLQLVVAGARGVFASPSFTPDGKRLVWVSDRSGRSQLETAPIAAFGAPIDTMRWRVERDDVRVVSSVSSGVFDPSVSPDGARVAALFYRADGYHVSWAPLDTVGAIARSAWYPAKNTADLSVPNMAELGGRTESAVVTGYSPLRQLVPRYWMPLIGEGRNGGATYGASTSGVDILGRHAWTANALVQPQLRETDAFASYRYAGLGIQLLDVSAQQEWDGTFRAVSDSGATLGFIARRRRFVTGSSTWRVPRVRRSVSATLGAQYEMRDFTSDVDSALGAPNSLLRTGTRYGSFFASSSVSTARLGARGISVEEGFTLSGSTAYRWREDDALGSGAWRSIVGARHFLPLNLPGFSRHVIATRATIGVAQQTSTTEFSVGGTSGQSAELLPGVVVGDPSRTFSLRGVAPGTQRGIRALAGGVEYRAPLVLFKRLPSPFTLFVDRMSVTLFSDAARAWCPGALARSENVVCERPGERDGWLASAGAELVVDLAVQYDTPYRLRIGGAAPYVAPRDVSRGGAFYVTLGGYF